MDLPAARSALEAAQIELDRINTDLAEVSDFLPHLADLCGRVQRLEAFNRGDGQRAADLLRETGPDEPWPSVAGEDAVWEAIVDHDRLMQQLLRICTGALTAGLDDQPEE